MSEQPDSRIPAWTTGDRLRKALDHAGMKVGQMAEYLGVERNTVGNYIAGRTHIPGPALRLWAMRTGVPLQWLETGIDPDTDRLELLSRQAAGGEANRPLVTYPRLVAA